MILCEKCNRSFSTVSNLNRHKTRIHVQNRTQYECGICQKLYCRNDILKRHSISIQGIPEIRFNEVIVRNQPLPIEKIKPWTPPFKARFKPVFRINFITDPKFTAITIEEALQAIKKKTKKMTNDELMRDLYVTPSPSISSTSSISTVLDEWDTDDIITERRPYNRVYKQFA